MPKDADWRCPNCTRGAARKNDPKNFCPAGHLSCPRCRSTKPSTPASWGDVKHKNDTRGDRSEGGSAPKANTTGKGSGKGKTAAAADQRWRAEQASKIFDQKKEIAELKKREKAFEAEVARLKRDTNDSSGGGNTGASQNDGPDDSSANSPVAVLQEQLNALDALIKKIPGDQTLLQRRAEMAAQLEMARRTATANQDLPTQIAKASRQIDALARKSKKAKTDIAKTFDEINALKKKFDEACAAPIKMEQELEQLRLHRTSLENATRSEVSTVPVKFVHTFETMLEHATTNVLATPADVEEARAHAQIFQNIKNELGQLETYRLRCLANQQQLQQQQAEALRVAAPSSQTSPCAEDFIAQASLAASVSMAAPPDTIANATAAVCASAAVPQPPMALETSTYEKAMQHYLSAAAAAGTFGGKPV